MPSYPRATYRWDVEGESVSTATIVVALGSVLGADATPPDDFAALTGVREVDDQRDVFVPVRATVRNTIGSFDLAPSVTLGLHHVDGRFDARIGILSPAFPLADTSVDRDPDDDDDPPLCAGGGNAASSTSRASSLPPARR